MILAWGFLFFFQPAASPITSAPAADQLAGSGRLIGLATPPSERLNPPRLIAPGQPPVLSFRTFDVSDRGRFSALGLMTDDAGH